MVAKCLVNPEHTECLPFGILTALKVKTKQHMKPFYILHRTVVLATYDLAGHVNVKLVISPCRGVWGIEFRNQNVCFDEDHLAKLPWRYCNVKIDNVTWVLVLLKFVWCFEFFSSGLFVKCFTVFLLIDLVDSPFDPFKKPLCFTF